MALVLCTPSHLHLSINQVPLQSFCTFQDMARTGNKYEKWLRRDYSINIQGRSMGLESGPSPNCHLSIYQVLFKCHQ